jgi:hypothetical protein
VPTRPDGRDRLAAAQATLVAAVEALADSGAWRRMLDVAARFPSYSTNNCLLIASQKPDATRVCGIRTWNSLGRRVRQGEKGIAILAPCLYRPRSLTGDHSGPSGGNRRPAGRGADFVRRDRSGPGGAPDWHAGTGPWTETPDRPAVELAHGELRGFRVVHVWDLTQTEGAPLPHIAPVELTGDAGVLPDRLAEAIHADGFAVERGPCRGANGYTDFAARVVRVRADVADAQYGRTLAHELGHVRADHERRFLGLYARSLTCRAQAEVEAESIAYLVAAAAGLPTEAYSVPYLAGWSGGDSTVLRETAARVLTVARGINADLGLDCTPTAVGPPPSMIHAPFLDITRPPPEPPMTSEPR